MTVRTREKVSWNWIPLGRGRTPPATPEMMELGEIDIRADLRTSTLGARRRRRPCRSPDGKIRRPGRAMLPSNVGQVIQHAGRPRAKLVATSLADIMHPQDLEDVRRAASAPTYFAGTVREGVEGTPDGGASLPFPATAGERA